MNKEEEIRQALLLSKTKAQEQIDRLYESSSLSFEDVNECMTAYILAKFMLEPKDCENVDFQKLSELSLSKSMQISPELVKEFDTARSCAGATSAIAKKTLLYLSIQKALKIELAAEKTPKIHTFEEFSSLVWDGMKENDFWYAKMRKKSNMIDKIQERIIKEFNEIGDSFDQYAYLIELACAHIPMPEKEKTEDRLVKGCQSQVWIKPCCEEGTFCFTSDSNTLIVKGVLYLLEKTLNGQPCKDVAGTEIVFLRETSVMDTFESDRQKGIGYVIKTLQEAARANS